jgi:hypothetical protein
MNRAKIKSIPAAVALTALISIFAAGCYYDRDDHWGYRRYPDRYSSRYDRDGYWRHDRDSDRRYSRSDPLHDQYND